MIRFVANGDKAQWCEIESRLRGVTFETSRDFSRDSAIPIESDAMLLVESDRPAAGLVERCLAAQKHVLLVADSWLSHEVLERLSGAARQNGVRLAVLNPDRFLPSRQLVRQQLDGGHFGEPGLVRLHRWESATAGNDGLSTDLPRSLLRDIELALSLIGSSPNLVFAVESWAKDHSTSSGRMIQVHLGFPGGGMSLIDYSSCLPPGDGYASLTVIGSSGAAYADDQQNMQLIYRGGHPQSVRVEEGCRQLVSMVQEFVDGLAANEDFSWSVTAWRNVLDVANAVQRSLVSRRAIAVEF